MMDTFTHTRIQMCKGLIPYKLNGRDQIN
uniref:Uncharacterized protein n=1 Tax=Rhizophora mucronata TaxID=61149 RepID=A0A2P2Q858_RHIMU